MTNSDLTLIAVLVDRSGSMSTCQSDMEGGLNTLIADQATQPGQAEVTLAQFDSEYELVWPITPIADVGKYSLVPRGSTALLDAMGKFITQTGEELAQRDETSRPGKVICVVVTDGYENSSKEWKTSEVKKLVEQQQTEWSWEFVFLGANMDAVEEGKALGFSSGSSLTFDTANAAQAYGSTSSYLSSVRSSGVATFSDKDRDAAMGK